MNLPKADGERGSIVLFTMFVCVAIAVLVQTLSVVVVCAHRGRDAEDQGRRLMSDKDLALGGVRQELLLAWAPRGRLTSSGGPEDVETTVADVPESAGWALTATASHPADVSPISVSAWVERGRDGVDLPMAGLVAESAAWRVGRASPWLEREAPDVVGFDDGRIGESAAWLCAAPQAPPLGPDVGIGSLPAPWTLDEGWQHFFQAQGGADSCADALAFGSTVSVLAGQAGRTIGLPSEWGERADEPALVVVTGGASLDATDRGDVYGVIVVDDGSVALDGTKIHGAVFATDTVDFGSSGEILFSPAILRWATDRSLVRTRLVPGSRRESTG